MVIISPTIGTQVWMHCARPPIESVLCAGYTCHQLGSGGIVIQLCQPHVVSSMRSVRILVVAHDHRHSTACRLLLWDCDNRSYSYYIDTSYDNVTWSKAVDRQTVACR